MLAKKDPTKTITLRARFSADMDRRFKELRRAIIKMIDTEDIFGLKEEKDFFSLEKVATPGQVRKWQYYHDNEKIIAFGEWLEEQQKLGILEVINKPSAWGVASEEIPWTNTYIETAYQKGILQARVDLKKAGVEGLPPTDPLSGGVSSLFNQPIHINRIAPIFTRVFSDLKGVTAAMDAQMSRVLALGLAEGKSPYTIAYDLANRVDKIGITRARLIARTEVVRTHNMAALNEYEFAEGLIGEEILIKWNTALDERVRDKHSLWARRVTKYGIGVYTRQEAMGMIGDFNCRCAVIPYIPSIENL